MKWPHLLNRFSKRLYLDFLCVGCVCVHASLQSCDGSEYTLQGPAGGDDITGLSAEPAHYQLLSELGENATKTAAKSCI